MKKLNKFALRRSLPFLLLTLLFSTSYAIAAQTADWRPTLVKPKSGVFGQSETIHILLPKQLSAETLSHLALELDDIDVTSLVSLTGNQADIKPLQPLAWGKHRLRLVEYATDGSIVERGAWVLEVRQSKHFREASLQTNATLNGAYRMMENSEQTDLPARFQTTGSASVAGAIADEGWRVNGNADFLYNSQEQLTPSQHRKLDLGQFLITAKTGALTVNAGRQTIDSDSMIMQGFNRRGVSLSLTTEDSSASVTGFALHAQDIVGFQDGLGIGDAENRVDGVVANYRPLSSDPNALLISASYLNGTGPSQTGVASGGSPEVDSGHASSVSADGQLLDNRLRLRGEYATTAYNFDYLNPASQTTSSYAYSALAQYTPWHDKVVGGQPLVLDFGLERTRIGTFFRSLANPTGISDRKGLQGVADLAWSGLNAQVVLGRETDNVDDLAILPRTRTTQTSVILGYTPPQVPGADGQLPPMPWYGQPSYNLSYIKVDQAIDKTGSISSLTGGLHSTRNLTFSASFNYTQSNWSISETLGDDDDLTNLGPDTKSQQTQLNASVYINDKLTLGPSLQYNHVTNKNDAGMDSDTTGVGLNIGYTFTPRLSANVNYMQNHQHIRNGLSDQLTRDTTASLSWTVQTAKGLKPGIALALEGFTHKLDDRVNTSSNVDNYQVNLKLTVSFASGY